MATQNRSARPTHQRHASLSLSLSLFLFLFLTITTTSTTTPTRAQHHGPHQRRNASDLHHPVHHQAADTPTRSPHFQLILKILTYDRSSSLIRLLTSLRFVDFANDAVDMDIYVDRSKDKDAQASVLAISENYHWPHGRKTIHERVVNVGVMGQWIEGWTPGGPNEYAIFLEDDMEVSPLFYRWLKVAVRKYSRANHQVLGRIFGISLQRPLIVSSTRPPLGKLPVENGNMPFAYQLTGTWGQVFFPGPWKQFRAWFREKRRDPSFEPLVDGLINTEWYKMVKNNAWEQWVIRWAHDNGRFCVYANFESNSCMATNHRELGNNYHTRMGKDCSVIRRPIPSLSNFDEIPQFFNFSVLPADLEQYGRLPASPKWE